jgi:prolyl-tRNA editing enzyme YbaK/EbsC (Cys-tRNA(Pro) deacylase)
VSRVLVEQELLQEEIVWIGAGSSRHMAGLAPLDLVRLANAVPVDLAEA